MVYLNIIIIYYCCILSILYPIKLIFRAFWSKSVNLHCFPKFKVNINFSYT